MIKSNSLSRYSERTNRSQSLVFSAFNNPIEIPTNSLRTGSDFKESSIVPANSIRGRLLIVRVR